MFCRAGSGWPLMVRVGVQGVSKSVSKNRRRACLVEPPARVNRGGGPVSSREVGLGAGLELTDLAGQKCHAKLRGGGLKGLE